MYYVVLRFYRKYVLFDSPVSRCDLTALFRSLRELKRMEATQRSPLQARIGETLDGIPTILAYRRGKDFERAVSGLLDQANKPTFVRFSAGSLNFLLYGIVFY